MIDLIERLREWAKWCHDNNVKAEVQRTMHEAADEIERLTDENAKLQAVVERIANLAEIYFHTRDYDETAHKRVCSRTQEFARLAFAALEDNDE